MVNNYRPLTNRFKPLAQSLHIDLSEDANDSPTHLGFRNRHHFSIEFLHALEEVTPHFPAIHTK